MEEARALHRRLADEPVGLGVATRLVRTQETLALALEGRDVERMILPGLDEIRFGAYEGGPLEDYRAWAWTNEPAAPCPGSGESRVEAALRFAGALRSLLERPEDVVLAVSHALPIRYVLVASEGGLPSARIGKVPHATPFPLDAAAVGRAAETLARWAIAPRFQEPAGD